MVGRGVMGCILNSSAVTDKALVLGLQTKVYEVTECFKTFKNIFVFVAQTRNTLNRRRLASNIQFGYVSVNVYLQIYIDQLCLRVCMSVEIARDMYSQYRIYCIRCTIGNR